MEAQTTVIFSIRYERFKFIASIMRKEGFKTLTLTGYSEYKRVWEERRVTNLTESCKCMPEQVIGDIERQTLLKA